jgi:hypothetical protein
VIILAHVVLWVCLGIFVSALLPVKGQGDADTLARVIAGFIWSGMLIGIPISAWAVVRFWMGG